MSMKSIFEKEMKEADERAARREQEVSDMKQKHLELQKVATGKYDQVLASVREVGEDLKGRGFQVDCQAMMKTITIVRGLKAVRISASSEGWVIDFGAPLKNGPLTSFKEAAGQKWKFESLDAAEAKLAELFAKILSNEMR